LRISASTIARVAIAALILGALGSVAVPKIVGAEGCTQAPGEPTVSGNSIVASGVAVCAPFNEPELMTEKLSNGAATNGGGTTPFTVKVTSTPCVSGEYSATATSSLGGTTKGPTVMITCSAIRPRTGRPLR
jgi:hypothetical protein